MKTSDSLKDFMPAFIKAQNEFTHPSKNKKGYGYKYADLPSILDMARPILSKYGLCYIQSTNVVDDAMVVETRIYHSSGEYIGDSIKLLIDQGKMSSMQQLGSSITYARRYSLQNLLGIVGDEDDDGVASKDISSYKQAAPRKPTVKELYIKKFKELANNDQHNRAYIISKVECDAGMPDTATSYWETRYKQLSKITKEEIETAVN
jgi:hypothetical protein